MTSKFCPKCGRVETKNNPLVNEFCQTCFSKDNPLLQKYKKLKVIICPSCKSYLHKNKWQPAFSSEKSLNLKKIIKHLLPEKLKFSPGSKISSIEIHPNLTKRPVEAETVMRGIINGVKSKETYLFLLEVESSLCNLCKKRNSSYFEATIQIRPKNEKLLNFIRQDLKQRGKIFISSSEENKYGYDLNITSKKYINSLLQKVKKKFQVDSKITKTLFGRKKGKDVYRITLLLRLKE